jgi:hypothetical protein
MPRYYFDTCDGETFVVDDEGIELAGLQSARYAATQALGEMAKDALPGAVRRELFVEVRGEEKPLIRAVLSLEVIRLGQKGTR